LHPDDLAAGADRVRLEGRRLRHISEVHRASVGDELCVVTRVDCVYAEHLRERVVPARKEWIRDPKPVSLGRDETERETAVPLRGLVESAEGALTLRVSRGNESSCGLAAPGQSSRCDHQVYPEPLHGPARGSPGEKSRPVQ